MNDRPEGNEFNLAEPGWGLARQVLREVPWEERFEGTMYHPGPGGMVERMYSLQEVHNLLKAMPLFSLDYQRLGKWVGETLGDQELAAAISETEKENLEEERGRIVALLGHRLGQCKMVLEKEA